MDLPAELGTPEAEQLKARLLELQGSDQTVLLNGQSVKRIGAAGLQILAAFALDERKRGRHLSWGEASDALRSAAELTGLTQLLSLQPQSEAS